MGRAPCCDRDGLKKGAWSQEEDQNLVQYIQKHGPGGCGHLLRNAGLLRFGKSCQLRWTNYLRPDVKRAPLAPEEVATIIQLHAMLGNKWVAIASQLPGRTDNEIKNFWNNCLKKSLSGACQKSQIHKPFSFLNVAKGTYNSPSTHHMVRWEGARGDAGTQISTQSKLLNSSTTVTMEYYDPFLRLWNSEVGESFRRIKVKEDRACDESFVQASLSVKLETASSDETVHGTTLRRSISRETTHKQENSCKPNVNLLTGLNSMDSNALTGSSYAEGDPFLRLWNSEAGELFRKIKVKEDRVSNGSFVLASASVKLEPGLSDVTVLGATLRRSVSRETTHEQEDCYKPNEYLLTGSDSMDTNAFADSSDAALKLLLDFPGGSDMEIIQGQIFSNLLDLRCDRNFVFQPFLRAVFGGVRDLQLQMRPFAWPL